MNRATLTGKPYFGGLDVRGCRVVVVGGADTARRRLPRLLDAGAEVVVVAPTLSPALRPLVADGKVVWWARPYRSEDLDGAWLAVVGTGYGSVAAQLTADAAERRIFCIGHEDALATAALPHAARVGELSVAVHHDDRSRSSRTLAAIVGAAESGKIPGLEPKFPTVGVALVGGGLGDPNLLTVRGRRLLAAADVVVIDGSRCRELVRGLGRNVEIIDTVALAATDSAPGPGAVEDVLIDRARNGSLVVRVTSGDPFLEGPGRAELLACERAGVPVTVVPSVAAAHAASAAANIPLNHLDGTQEIVTAALGPAPEAAPDWSTLGPSSAAVVVLFVAGSGLGDAARRLIECGRPADTPVTVVAAPVSRTWQILQTTLTDVDALVLTRGLKPPLVVVIGAMAALSPPTETGRRIEADMRAAGRARAGD